MQITQKVELPQLHVLNNPSNLFDLIVEGEISDPVF